ncbi:hypothetical protein SPFM12_00005 [Salmonella phage SPFM12]|nr:hypothetical protein SPFM12_00005 [Salmonella phage SPFM12]
MSLLEIFLMFWQFDSDFAVDAIDPDALVSRRGVKPGLYAATFEKGDDVERTDGEIYGKDTESDAKLFSLQASANRALLTVTRCKRAAITLDALGDQNVPTYDGPYPFKSFTEGNRLCNFKSPVVYRSKAHYKVSPADLVGTDVKVEYTIQGNHTFLASMLSRRVQGQLAVRRMDARIVDCTEFGYVLRTDVSISQFLIEANDVTYRLEPIEPAILEAGEVFEAIKHRSRMTVTTMGQRPTKPLPFQVNVRWLTHWLSNDPSEDDPWLRSAGIMGTVILYSTATIPQNLSILRNGKYDSMNTVLARLLAEKMWVLPHGVICEMVQVGGLPRKHAWQEKLRTGQIHSAQQVYMLSY